MLRINSPAITKALDSQFAGIFNIAPALPAIGEMLRTSIDENFRVGGRYGNDNPYGGGNQRWKISARARRDAGQTLLDTRRLANSITYRIQSNTIILGTNVVYGPIHQFGGTIDHPGGTAYAIIKGRVRFVRKTAKHIIGYTRPHKITIPARPFIVVQNDDFIDVREYLIDYLGSIIRGAA